MSYERHTPAPWFKLSEGLSMAIVKSAVHDRWVAVVHTHDECREPDADLIAAAPELLHALKSVLAAWKSVPGNAQVPDEINDDDLWEMIESAIDKAEGVPL